MPSRKFVSNMLRIAGYGFTSAGAALYIGLLGGNNASPLAGTFLQTVDGNITTLAQGIAVFLLALGVACMAFGNLLPFFGKRKTPTQLRIEEREREKAEREAREGASEA